MSDRSLFFVWLWLAVCGGLRAQTKPQLKEWTLLLYAAADEKSIQIPTYHAIRRLESISALSEASQVNLLLQYDDVGNDPNYRYLIHHVAQPSRGDHFDSSPVPEAEIRRFVPAFHYGEKDSGNVLTLKDFLRWGVRAFPARHYGLILSGHSWGQQGMMQDFYVGGKTLERSTLVKNYELRRMMEELYREEPAAVPGGRFDVLVVDACIAGQLEIALELGGVFRYFVGSTMETPDNSFPFDEVLGAFASAVDSPTAASAQSADRILEDQLLRPLVERYVRSHSRGGSLVPAEGDLDVVEAMALRSSRVPEVATALRDLLRALPPEARSDWQARRMSDLEALADMDGNADLRELSRRLQSYAQVKYDATQRPDWKRAAAQANRLVQSLGYGVDDSTMQPVELSHPSAVGAWACLGADEVSRSPELAACLALKYFAMLNAGDSGIVPRFHDEDGTEVSAGSIDCSELSEQHPDGAPIVTSDPRAITHLWDLDVRWPQGLPAYLSEATDAAGNHRRSVWLWLPGEKGGVHRRVFLRVPFADRIEVSYLSGEAQHFVEQGGKDTGQVLATARLDVPPWVATTDPSQLEIPFHPGEPGLYVAEAHTAGAIYKEGLGIYLGHEFSPNDDYAGGRLPIERVESSPFSLRLEDYFASLAHAGQLESYALEEEDFYRAHRIASTGWADFIFDP